MSNTIFSVYNETKEKLKALGIEDYGFEARQIIRHITGFDNKTILENYNSPISDYQKAKLYDIVKRRQARYPLQYILGQWSFYGRTFKVDRGVLIPRADTEIVAEKALSLIENIKNPSVLDLCAGSGAIGITIALERPDSSVLMLEKYDKAIEILNRNKELNKASNAQIVKGDALSDNPADKEFDLIVSNPPYVSVSDMKNLQPEVRFEPEEALCPGEDEFLFYKKIANGYKNSINSGGYICFEVGTGMADKVKEILISEGFCDVCTQKDYSGTDRVVFGTVK